MAKNKKNKKKKKTGGKRKGEKVEAKSMLKFFEILF